MRPYEIMVIFDVGGEETDIRDQVERVLDLIRSRGDVPGQVDYWGRRTFAYEVKHRSEGYYVVIEATGEPATMAEVDRLLALEDSVLRHKVIRQPEKAAGRGRVTRQRPAKAAPGDEPLEPVAAPESGEAADEAAAS